MSELPPETDALLYPDPPIRDRGYLDVGDSHRLYYEESGAPEGLPVVGLHGGPGSGSPPWLRRFFDPARFRIIVYDQRGAGRSEPRGRLRNNTTRALVSDLETLRQHLNIERWLLFGGSWGATLALRYAQSHHDRVHGLILRGPLLGRLRDLDWFFGPAGVARIYPREYRAFVEALPKALRDLPIDGYQQLFHTEPEKAARAWKAWEHRVITGQALDDPGRADPAAGAITCHYAANGFFLPEPGLLADMDALDGIPGIIVQGQLDLICPAEGALTLARHWPEADLQLVEGAGHIGIEPALARALVGAGLRFSPR